MRKRKVLIGVCVVLAIVIAATAILWRSACYDDRGTVTAIDTVKVTRDNDVIFFDGPGADNALIFYPGAMVEHTAYAALMQAIAAAGTDCYLVRMPLRLALLNRDAADRIVRGFQGKELYIGGHSLGGVVACMYAAKHADELAGVVLLAAYPNGDLSKTELKVLSIVGSEDGVISAERMEASRAKLPADAQFVVIEGGNHAQFGTYGAQKGDGVACITPEAQRAQTCEAITAFIVGDGG